MLMASCTQKFETPLRKGLTNTNHHVAYAYQSTAAKKNCARQEISKLKSAKYILSYKISWVAQIILNFQFYISHIRLKSVTIGKKKIFAASHFYQQKNTAMPLQRTSILSLLKKNYAKMSYQHLHKTHKLSGVQYTLHNMISPLV
jgi:uncharacterized protein YfiM (DUF2279 family)